MTILTHEHEHVYMDQPAHVHEDGFLYIIDEDLGHDAHEGGLIHGHEVAAQAQGHAEDEGEA